MAIVSGGIYFDGIELGHASDTTLSRNSAGRMTVEGNLVAHMLTA